MSLMASQITSLAIVYSPVCSGTDQRKHQSSASLAFVRGNSPGPVNSPHKRPVTRKMLPFDDVIMNILGFLWLVPCIVRALAVMGFRTGRVDFRISLLMREKGPLHARYLLSPLCQMTWEDDEVPGLRDMTNFYLLPHTWSPFHKAFMSSLSKFLFTSYVNNDDTIRLQFCTGHDSWAVVTCAKLWADWTLRIWIRANINFKSFQLCAHKPSVKWVRAFIYNIRWFKPRASFEALIRIMALIYKFFRGDKLNHAKYIRGTCEKVSISPMIQGSFLCICPANGRRRYNVTSSLIGRAHVPNQW